MDLKVVVFGAGSIGLYCGGLLAKQGAELCFIGRKRFGDLLDQHGLTLSHYARPAVHIAPNRFDYAHDAKAAGDALAAADIVLICVKSQDSAEAAAAVKDYIGAKTIIISFQNGVGNADVLREVLPDHTVLGAVVPFNVTQVTSAPATWHCGTEGDLTIEAHSAEALKTLSALYDAAGQGVTFAPDIKAVQWGKLLVNLNNGLNALAGGTLRAGLMQRDYRRALASMIAEGLAVIDEDGVTPAAFGKTSPQKMIKVLRLPNWAYGFIMNRLIKIDANARSSMLDDLEAGRACEIDYLQGAIVARAAAQGKDAPINTRIMDAVRTAFSAGQSPKMSGTDILRLIEGGE